VDQLTIDQANASIQTMATDTVTEAQIENLVMAKGYQNCIAFLGENSISVVVSAPAEGLDSSDTARIMDIIVTETGLPTDQIKIIGAE
jgi:stage III sporulation protein AH